MKKLTVFLLTMQLFACKTEVNQTQVLQTRIDSLEHKLANVYKPGFGEFMSSIQEHHNKLWFAGKNQNWKLADFEIHEIMEAVDDIQKFETERKESKSIMMIKPSLDSLNAAIENQNPKMFKAKFTELTNTCNSCHRDNNFEFNVVKIPDFQPYSNQDFRVVKVK